MFLRYHLSKFIIKDSSQNQVSKTLKCNPRIKNTLKFGVCFTHNSIAQFLEKLSLFIHLLLRLSKTSIFGIIYRNYQNDSFESEISKNVKISSPKQTLVTFYIKVGE